MIRTKRCLPLILSTVFFVFTMLFPLGAEAGIAGNKLLQTSTPATSTVAPANTPTIGVMAATGEAKKRNSARYDYRKEIEAAEKKYGIPEGLLYGLIKQESGFNPNAKSGAGAVGLTQLMKGTANDLGVTDRTNPTQSINGGARYLKQMLNMFGNNPTLALMAYNWGPGNVQKYRRGEKKNVPVETQNYAPRVMANANQYLGKNVYTPDITVAVSGGSGSVGATGWAKEKIEHAGQVANELMKTFEDNLKKTRETISVYAERLLFWLLIIEFCWGMILLLLQDQISLGAVMSTLIRHFFIGGFFYWCIKEYDFVLGSIISSFKALSTQPDFVDLYSKVYNALGEFYVTASSKMPPSGWVDWVTFDIPLGSWILLFATYFFCVWGMGKILLLIIVTEIEGYIISTTGIIWLGFGGSRVTRSHALGFIRSLVAVGFKLFLLYLCASTMADFCVKQTGLIQEAYKDGFKSDLFNQDCLTLFGQGLLFALLAPMIPDIANSMTRGGDSTISGRSVGMAMHSSGIAPAARMAKRASFGAAALATGLVANAWKGRHSSRVRDAVKEQRAENAAQDKIDSEG